MYKIRSLLTRYAEYKVRLLMIKTSWRCRLNGSTSASTKIKIGT